MQLLDEVTVGISCFFIGIVAANLPNLYYFFKTRKNTDASLTNGSGFEINPSLAVLIPGQSVLTKTSTWINLGLWKSVDLRNYDHILSSKLINPYKNRLKGSFSFPEACEHMAVTLGLVLDLNEQDNVLDVAIGRGDQCLLWRKFFHVHSIVGIDVCDDHLASARELLFGYQDEISIVKCSATNIGSIVDTTVLANNQINKVISMDAAYHFDTRKKFLSDISSSILSRNGKIGLIDFALSNNMHDMNWFVQLCVKLFCFATKIPFQNLYTIHEFKKILCELDFKEINIQLLDEHVMDGFGEFVKYQKSLLQDDSFFNQFFKFSIVGWVLKYLYRNRLAHFILVTATKK